MTKLSLQKYDDVFLRVICEPDIAYELRDKFTFKVPGYQYMPKYRSGYWDGNIRLFNAITGRIYTGLLEQIKEYAKASKYEISIDPSYESTEFSIIEALEWLKTLDIPSKFTLREEQIKPFIYSVRNKRLLLLSPTGSGKSLIIYYIIRWFIAKGDKVLLIVPTTGLIHQMFNDFKDYGFDSDANCQKIYEGQTKAIIKPVTISTWQSIYNQPKNWFGSFGVAIGDEAHLYKADCLKKIMENLTNCPVKVGTTGTLDGTITNKMVLEGLFGPIRSYTTTKELMDAGTLSDLNIKAIVLSYPDQIRKSLAKQTYHVEMDFLVRYEPRNRFIKNLALSLDGNTLLLFQYVDKHGKMLYDSFSCVKDRKVFFIHGGVDGEERDEIRKIVNRESNAIVVASYGTFSVGVNLPNLHNIITGHPAKSRIRVLQSIGRGVRKGDNKNSTTLYDIADNLIWKKWNNHTIKHFQERIKLYSKEKFNYKIYTVKVG